MKNRLVALPIMIVLSIIVAWSAYKVFTANQPQPKKEISVLVPDSTDERWKSLKAGMDEAAADYNVIISYPSMNKYAKPEEQIEIIDREFSRGADAIIIEPLGSDEFYLYQENREYDNNIVFIGSDITYEGVFSSVTADNTEVGRKMGESLFEAYGEETYNLTYGLLIGPKEQYSMEERLNGFYEVVDKSKLNVLFTYYSAASIDDLLLNQQEIPDVIISFDNEVTELAIDFALEHPDSTTIIGEGYSEKTVYYLEKGIVKCLVAPNKFNLGYKSIELAAQYENNQKTTKINTIEIISVTLENLYDKNIEMVMFPNVQ